MSRSEGTKRQRPKGTGRCKEYKQEQREYWVHVGAKALAGANGMSRYMQAQRVKWTWSGIKGDSFVVTLTPIQYNEQF